MYIDEIKEKLPNWDKWGYSPLSREITCFTSWAVSFDEKKEMFSVTYKPKTWITGVNFSTFVAIVRNPEHRKNFCGIKKSIFTCWEEGETMTEDEIAKLEEETGIKELFGD